MDFWMVLVYTFFWLQVGFSRFCSLFLKFLWNFVWFAFFSPLYFFPWEEERFSRNINISSLSHTASVLPATEVCIPVVHRQKCCQSNNHFCLTNFQSFTYENSLIFINFRFLGHDFRVCVISLSFSSIDFFFIDICVYVCVFACLFPGAFVVRTTLP